MGVYRSIRVSKEDRERETIEMIKNNTAPRENGNNGFSSISGEKTRAWLTDNERLNFHRIVSNKVFQAETLARRLRVKTGRLSDVYDEQLVNDIIDYFKLCDDYKVIPTVATLGCYVGMSQNDLKRFADYEKSQGLSRCVVKAACDLCHSYLQEMAIDGVLNSVLYIFLSKAQFDLNDNTVITFKNEPGELEKPKSETLKAIQEQLKLEETGE